MGDVLTIKYSVLPACAGVILWKKKLNDLFERITRMRGGDPGQRLNWSGRPEYYPHARG